MSEKQEAAGESWRLLLSPNLDFRDPVELVPRIGDGDAEHDAHRAQRGRAGVETVAQSDEHGRRARARQP